MAATAITLTKVGKTEVRGREKVTSWLLDCTNYNQTDNIDLTPAMLGLKSLTDLKVYPQETVDLLLVWDGNKTVPTIVAHVASTGAEVATDVDIGVMRVEAIGK